MRVRNMEELQQRFLSYQNYVEVMMQEARKQENREAMQLLNLVWLRLRQGPVRTVVLGVSSAGKSTLINAISGAVVVPEGKRTTSPIPVWVYNRNPALTPRIQILKNREYEVNEIPCGRCSYLMEYCYTSKQAGAGRGQKKYENLVAATVNVNAPMLGSSGITLIDTPGIGVSTGDNDRVKEILKDSCEALIIMFMTLQEEETQVYFRNLLVEEDAPLRDLIEQDRVFLVLNNVKEYAHDIAIMDTRQHAKKTFDGWDGGERIYAMNAQDARICACGVYQYPDLLPQGFGTEDLLHAEDSLEKEVKKERTVKFQPEMERLCQNLSEMVEEMFEDPEALEQILVPIEEKLHQANTLLKKYYEKERSRIEKMEYSAPAELEEQKKVLTEQYDSLIALHTWLHDMKDTLLDYANRQWNEKEYLQNILLNSEYLLTEEKSQTNSFLQKEIIKDKGAEAIALLIEQRMFGRIQMLCEQLEDYKQNPESQYWDDLFSKLTDKLKEISDYDEMKAAQKEEISECILFISEILKKAKSDGKTEVMCADCCRITLDEKRLMEEYLLKKQKLILNDGIRSHFERFMLWVNFSVDMLNKILQRIIRDAIECYRQSYRQCIKQEYEKLYQRLHKFLLTVCVNTGKRRKEVDDEIQRYKENAKSDALARVDEQLQRLSDWMMFEKG